IPADADTTTNRLWGSVFGGAEDGHVLGNANVRYVSGFMGTFPNTVKVEKFEDVSFKDNKIKFKIPASSVLHLEVTV
ncbi:MAG: hypothetical protein IKR35_06025, partial [Lachnospiraceae bacterium]|nr:hypothetical protein [Lachnospiraceae bacterium]